MKSLVEFVAECEVISEAITKLETSFDKLVSHNKVDLSKEVYVVTRNVKKKEIHYFKFADESSLELFIDSLRDGRSEDGYFQMMSNDLNFIKSVMETSTYKGYKFIKEF